MTREKLEEAKTAAGEQHPPASEAETEHLDGDDMEGEEEE